MSADSDRGRWDRKYAAGEGPAHFEPNPLLTENHQLLTGGRALDLACGFGGSALYLASMGYRVDAVDGSGVALTQSQGEAAQRGLHVNFIQADITRWWVRPAHYHLIVVFYYLDRALIPRLAAGLRPGGLLFQANRNRRFLAVRPDFNPDYLVQAGELHRLASTAGLTVLHHADRTPRDPYISQLIARKTE